MEIGSVVTRFKLRGFGIYLYPHEYPVSANTVCSVLIDKIEMTHVPYNEILPYKNFCWKCKGEVNSMDNYTCPVCHWVSCYECHVCKRPKCESDGIIILDELDPSGWKELTGYSKESFFDEDLNDRYDYLGYWDFDDLEKYYVELLKRELHPIIIIDEYRSPNLYIESKYIDEAKKLQRVLGIYISSYSSDFEEKSIYKSKSCAFCGSSTSGDYLCPSCANNID